MNIVEEGKFEDLREQYVEKDGWFVPTLRIKFSQENSRDRHLKGLCSRWLAENFHINAEIREVEVLEREEIDEKLGLVCVKFAFSNKNEVEGDSVAFIDASEVKGLV